MNPTGPPDLPPWAPPQDDYRPPAQPPLPPWPRPSRPPANPWRLVGWLVALILALIIIGAAVAASKHTQCPAGYVWNSYLKACVTP